MIRSLFTIRQSPIQRILTNTNVYNKSTSSSIFKISLASQARHLTTNKKKITAEKLEKLEKNLEEHEYVPNPEEIDKPTKLLAKLTAIHREKWHLKQKPKVSSLIPHGINISKFINAVFTCNCYRAFKSRLSDLWIRSKSQSETETCFKPQMNE